MATSLLLLNGFVLRFLALFFDTLAPYQPLLYLGTFPASGVRSSIPVVDFASPNWMVTATHTSTFDHPGTSDSSQQRGAGRSTQAGSH